MESLVAIGDFDEASQSSSPKHRQDGEAKESSLTIFSRINRIFSVFAALIGVGVGLISFVGSVSEKEKIGASSSRIASEHFKAVAELQQKIEQEVNGCAENYKKFVRSYRLAI